MAFIGKNSVTVTSLDSAESMSVVTDLTVDTNTLKVDSVSNRVGILNATPSVSLDIGTATDAIHIPVGTTGERPGSPTSGLFRYNTSLNQFEGYTSTWGAIGGGGTNTFTHDSFTGDNSTTDFVLSQATESENNLFVFIDGVFQTQDAYSIATNSGITTLTLSAAPAQDRKIIVYTVAAGVSGNNLNQNLFDANTSDAVDGVNDTFTLSIPPVNKNNTQVFFDGVYQHKANYSVSGTSLTFTDAPPLGVVVEVMIFTQTAVNVPVDNSVTSSKLSGDLVAPGNLTVTGYLAGPSTFILDPSAVGDNTGTLLVKGNLQVDGTQTIINSTTLTVDDLNITLASGAANALAADGAGITIDTGSDPDATITYDGVNDRWNFNKNVDVTGTVTATGTSVFGSLDISGDIDVDGTANLDVVDIDGAVDMASTLTVGGNTAILPSSDGDALVVGKSGGSNLHFFSNAGASLITNAAAAGATRDGFQITSGNVLTEIDSVAKLSVSAAEIVVNDTGADTDFRVESDNNANMLFVDGGNDTIGIGVAPLNNSLSPALQFASGGTMFGYGDAQYITGNTYFDGGWKAIATGGGANTIIDSFGFTVYNNASASAGAAVTPLKHLTVGPSEMVINDDSYDYDFRVESNNNTHMIRVDGGNDRVGIGESAPTKTLSVLGDAIIKNTTDGTYLTLHSTQANNASGPDIVLFRDSASPANDDALSTILYQGKNSVGSTKDYMKVRSYILDVTDGTEDFGMDIQIMTAGTTLNAFDILPTELVINNAGIDRDFRVESVSNANMLFVDAGNDRVSIGDSVSNGLLTVVGGGTGSYNQLTLSNRTDANSDKVAGLTTLNYAGNNVSVFQSFNQSGANSLYFGSADDSHRGYTSINSYVASSDTATTGHRRIHKATYSEFCVNEDSNDVDFRVESLNNANMLHVDGGNNGVGIGTAGTTTPLTVNGGTASVATIQLGNHGDNASIHAKYNLLFKADSTESIADRAIGFGIGAGTSLGLTTSEAVFNDFGADLDFRVESVNDSSMLFVDASENTVNIGAQKFAATPTSTDNDFVHFNTGAILVNQDSSATVNLFHRSASGTAVSCTGTVFVACEASGQNVSWGYIIDFFYNNNVFTSTARETGSSQGTTTCSVQENGTAISVSVAYTSGLGGNLKFNAGGHAVVCNY